MTTNVFYTEHDIKQFKHALKNDKVKNDFMTKLMRGYPENFEDLSFTKQGTMDVASYQGKDLFAVVRNKVKELKTGNITVANTKTFMDTYKGEMTLDAIQSFMAKQFFECRKEYVKTYLDFKNQPKIMFDTVSQVPGNITQKDIMNDFTAPAFRM